MQTLSVANGTVLQVQVRDLGDELQIRFSKQSGPGVTLHWGLVHAGGRAWQRPPKWAWPPGSTSANRALDTRLGDAPVTFQLERDWRIDHLELVFFDPKNGRWDSNQGRNYRIDLPPPPPLAQNPVDAAEALAGRGDRIGEGRYELGDGYALAVAAHASDAGVQVGLATDLPAPLYLHWGIAPNRRDWRLPPSETWPTNTRAASATAALTPWREEGGLRTVRLAFPGQEPPPALTFVLWQSEADLWWKDQGRNFYLPLRARAGQAPPGQPAVLALADEIVERETGAGSWTLMHRFDLAWNLLDRLPEDPVPALALLFVWLRFSAIRQLDWQRNYNTKPRELSHAQDRLTVKLAERASRADARTRPLWRMLAGTLGRGGDGQRVRDGILEIMHRHNVKEVAGHFLEEWHQKLHNNTTPDDVVICEAYLELLRKGGDRPVFYRVLEAGGVTRERLLGFERPIRSEPEFVPGLQDALIKDFTAFLEVLRSVHSATDLGGTIAQARGFLDEHTRQLLDGIWNRREESQARGWLLRSITEAREALARQLQAGHAGLRDLLYLDLALEEFFRVMVERNLHQRLSLDELLEWTLLSLRNLVLVRSSEELSLCRRHLGRVLDLGRSKPEWALHAQAVLERMRRALADAADADAKLLQPMAEYLGAAFGAARWTIETFTEEVLRGRIDLAASALLRKLDEGLRQIAGMGRWQIISPGSGRVVGRVATCASLAEVQTKSFERDTVLIATRITGEEEIPVGIVAVLTESSLDLLAHVAVRARNRGVLLATAWNPDDLASLTKRQGSWARLTVSSDGDILAEDAAPSSSPSKPAQAAPRRTVLASRPATSYVIGEDSFSADNVGAKSRNLKQLRTRLPSSMNVPSGVALPYGVLARVLDQPSNRERAQRYRQLQDASANDDPSAKLRELSALILGLEPPEGLEAALGSALTAAGIPLSRSFAEAWQCIKRVWASQWNERAYLSRRAQGGADDGVEMAVLIQQVVPADLAFVIHTANPVTGNRDELVAEMVLGLGETLVGNRPGRALGFRYARGQRDLRLTSFPSKSVGLFGEGLMFRSDSNGEDLAGFAGAGLYDSIMLPEPRSVLLDYEHAEILWNEELRKRILEGVAELGIAVEGVFGAPQDVEGTWAGGRFFVVQARPQVGLDHG